jgi:hypothetical protein
LGWLAISDFQAQIRQLRQQPPDAITPLMQCKCSEHHIFYLLFFGTGRIIAMLTINIITTPAYRKNTTHQYNRKELLLGKDKGVHLL